MSWTELVVPFLGTVALIALTWALGRLRTATLDPESAHARLRRDDPEFPIGATTIASDGTVALLSECDGPRVALVMTVGDRFATRVLTPGGVLGVRPADDNGTELVVELPDFTAPTVRLRLSSGSEADAWRTRLAALVASATVRLPERGRATPATPRR